MAKKQIPIGGILIDRPYLKSRAIDFCKRHKIETAEQLATYNRFAFKIGGNFRTTRVKASDSEKTIAYLEECLKNAGMSFSLEHPQASGIWPPYKIYGKENTKKELLAAMREIGKYDSMTGIALQANRDLEYKLVPYEYYEGQRLLNAESFSNSVFALKIIKPFFDELVDEGKAEKIETTKGFFYSVREN